MPRLSQYPFLLKVQALGQKKKTELFLVGGFLRDGLLSVKGHDFDFALPKNAIAFARVFAKEIKGAFVLLDKERGCARVAKKYDGRIETYDFADFRATPFKKDLQARDFTINTLFVKLNKLQEDAPLFDHIEDLYGGLKDLKAKRIKMVSKSAFRDDPLRLLRGYSLSAKFGFSIEAKTAQLIKKERELLRQAAPERILDEFFKILESDRCAVTLKNLDKIGLLEVIVPQVTIMYRVHQGGYHHLDVWKHSLEVVTQLEVVLAELRQNKEIAEYLDEELAGGRTRQALLKLGALLHDIGKPQTRKKEKDRMSFHGHEHVGKGITRHIAKQLKLSSRERHILEDMVLWHLRPGYLSNVERPTERSYFRYFRDTKGEAGSIAILAMADQRGTRGPLTSKKDAEHHDKICREVLRRFWEMRNAKPVVRLLDGNDLIKNLKLKPSPLFGKILKTVEEAQGTGQISSREEALVLAKKIVQKI